MAEFTPNVPDGPFTSTLSADCTAGQCLVVSGDNTVAPSSAASVAYVGIAAFDAKSGDKITLLNEGNFTLAASGAIAAGELVTTAASGAVATQGTASAANDVQVIGVALAAAASSKVKVRIFR